jgi:hypothetical protein
MMDDRQHEHEVEAGFETRQQGNRLLVLPADGRSGTREVRLDGLDGETALAGHPEEAVGCCHVALERDDLRPHFGGKRAELSGIGADVEHAGGLRGFQGLAHPVELLTALLGGVVGQGALVFAPA